MTVKIFADGADIETIKKLAENPLVQGFTTNPTLMRKAGVTNYEEFARAAVDAAGGRSVSFETVSDNLEMIEAEARKIASWSPESIYVKLPITTTAGEDILPLAKKLSADGVRVNVTAICTARQAITTIATLDGLAPAYVSVFAGRIADTGRDPLHIMITAVEASLTTPNIEIIWASPRESYNMKQADKINCHIITVTPEILAKHHLLGGSLEEMSLATVKMFAEDAKASGLTIL